MMRLQNCSLEMGGGGGHQSPWGGHCSWLLGNTSGLMDVIYPVYLYFSYQDRLQN